MLAISASAVTVNYDRNLPRITAPDNLCFGNANTSIGYVTNHLTSMGAGYTDMSTWLDKSGGGRASDSVTVSEGNSVDLSYYSGITNQQGVVVRGANSVFSSVEVNVKGYADFH